MTDQEFKDAGERLKKAELLRQQIDDLDFALRIYADRGHLGLVRVSDGYSKDHPTEIKLESSAPAEVHHAIAGVLRGWLSRVKAELEAL